MYCGLVEVGSHAMPHVVGRVDETVVDGAGPTIPIAVSMAMPERQNFAQDKLAVDDFVGYNLLLVEQQRPLEVPVTQLSLLTFGPNSRARLTPL